MVSCKSLLAIFDFNPWQGQQGWRGKTQQTRNPRPKALCRLIDTARQGLAWLARDIFTSNGSVYPPAAQHDVL